MLQVWIIYRRRWFPPVASSMYDHVIGPLLLLPSLRVMYFILFVST